MSKSGQPSDGGENMIKLRLVPALIAAIFIGSAVMLIADPFLDEPDSRHIELASLNVVSDGSKSPEMTIIPEGALERMLGLPAKTPKLLQFAGRCGSSNYYCDKPGATYCCGNSTDGFYCAADVNGC